MISFIFYEITAIVLQFILFIPLYPKYRKDCNEIDKKHLAVSLYERFTAWCIGCPFWLIPIVICIK